MSGKKRISLSSGIALITFTALDDVAAGDNFNPKEIISTVNMLKKAKLRKKVRLEVSGGINERNISRFAKTGIDMISVGEITNSVTGIDFSLEVP